MPLNGWYGAGQSLHDLMQHLELEKKGKWEPRMGCKSKILLLAAAAAILLAACSAETEQTQVAAARLALDKGEFQTASIQLKNAPGKNPESGQARFLFGRLMLESGNFGAAEVELRKAQEREHPVDEVAPLLARSLLGRQQYKKIIDDYAGLELADPARRADLSSSVAIAYLFSGQRDKAAALVDAVFASTPGNAPIRLLKARLIAGQGDIDGALKLLEQTISGSPGNIEAWRLQGDLLLYGKQDQPRAMLAYRKVLEIRGNDIEAHTRLIGINLLGKDLKEGRPQI